MREFLRRAGRAVWAGMVAVGCFHCCVPLPAAEPQWTDWDIRELTGAV